MCGYLHFSKHKVELKTQSLSCTSPCQMPSSHVWLVATVLGITDVQHFHCRRSSVSAGLGGAVRHVLPSVVPEGSLECVSVGWLAGGAGQS